MTPLQYAKQKAKLDYHSMMFDAGRWLRTVKLLCEHASKEVKSRFSDVPVLCQIIHSSSEPTS